MVHLEAKGPAWLCSGVLVVHAPSGSTAVFTRVSRCVEHERTLKVPVNLLRAALRLRNMAALELKQPSKIVNRCKALLLGHGASTCHPLDGVQHPRTQKRCLVRRHTGPRLRTITSKRVHPPGRYLDIEDVPVDNLDPRHSGLLPLMTGNNSRPFACAHESQDRSTATRSAASGARLSSRKQEPLRAARRLQRDVGRSLSRGLLV
jgi:hypothetical protein